jgi:hypothetical protein
LHAASGQQLPPPTGSIRICHIDGFGIESNALGAQASTGFKLVRAMRNFQQDILAALSCHSVFLDLFAFTRILIPIEARSEISPMD